MGGGGGGGRTGRGRTEIDMGDVRRGGQTGKREDEREEGGGRTRTRKPYLTRIVV